MKARPLAVMLGLIAFAHSAGAADMAAKAPLAAPLQAQTWTGFYVGANIGWGWSDADFVTEPTGAWLGFPALVPLVAGATTRRLSPDGLMFGGPIGYNHQFDQFVLGVEGDFNFYDAQESFTGGPIAGTTVGSTFQESEQKWFATIRGRLGVTFGRWLVYGTGGVGFSDWRTTVRMNSTTTFPTFTSDGTRTGWVLGGGVEVALNRNWSIKGEYLYADFGDVTGTSVFPPPALPDFTHNHRVDLTTQTVRLGVNYRF